MSLPLLYSLVTIFSFIHILTGTKLRSRLDSQSEKPCGRRKNFARVQHFVKILRRGAPLQIFRDTK